MTKFEIYDKIKDLKVSNIFVCILEGFSGEKYIAFQNQFIIIDKSGQWNGLINDNISALYLYVGCGYAKSEEIDGNKYVRDFIPAPKKKLLKVVRPHGFRSVINSSASDRYRIYDDGSVGVVDGFNNEVEHKDCVVLGVECKDELLQPESRTLLYCVRHNIKSYWRNIDRVRVYSDGTCECVKLDGLVDKCAWTKSWVENETLKQPNIVKCDDSPRYVYPLTEVKVVDVKHLVRTDAMVPVQRGVVMTIDKFLYEYGYHYSLSNLIRERFKESGATHISF